MRLQQFRTRIHQNERTGAESTFGVTRTETGLPKQRRLLVAGHTGNGYSVWQARNTQCVRHHATGRHNLRQNTVRHLKQRHQFLIPAASLQVHERRSRSIRHVGHMRSASAEPGNQVAVNRTGRHLSCAQLTRYARCVTQQPAKFTGRKVRVQHQA